MPDLTPLLDFVGVCLPFEDLAPLFMRRALVALLLLAPMTAALGVMVVNFRMAFFSDAVSHSAFAGVALGLLFSVNPHWTMPLLGVAVGVGIVALKRHSRLSSDTAIGVLFAAVTAFGLAIVSRDRSLAREVPRFLYGDILTLTDGDLWQLLGLFLVFVVFEWFGHNRLLAASINSVLAEAHRIKTARYEYGFAALLALVVIFAVNAVGVLLVTALLVVPAAAARAFSRSARRMFLTALGIAWISAVVGLWLSAQEWMATATGATIILVAFVAFLLTSGYRRLFNR